ncbi:hypothetical protein N7468_000476 [Penicillium chermesinum]|uniref:penicillopepsin n=1 Tax=Penicillium chermesinum TaxID=63820 RepID=A0A9W9PMB6_9EURO|nr:uncharacterized protein N7468_000476 [Penicillium chermesinum]KAJ5249025.1 hypothetical protein N7468_000476 [Penicillium chermesinum]
MWGSAILPIALLAALPCANAITLHKRSEPAVLGLPIVRTERSQALQKRDSKTVSADLYNLVGAGLKSSIQSTRSPGKLLIPSKQNMQYWVNITVGTPAQKVSLTLDTGSSDVWVNIPNSTFCSADDDPCSPYGVFKQKDSSTFHMLDYQMNATYAAGFLAEGYYATDTLSIGGVKVKDYQFAVADISHNENGILGVGYQKGTDAYAIGKEYTNLPGALVKSGATNSAAYSLWLNKLDSTGNILFGGVNKARYNGELQSVPILKVYGEYRSLAIALTEITVKDKTYASGLPLAVSLDNGSSMIALPKELLDPIYKDIGAGYDSKSQFGYISCDAAHWDYNITFSFSQAKVSMPISTLVFPHYSETSFPKGDCIFGMVPSQPGVNLMGDPFLRGAYVVYDLDNNEISLAETNTNDGDDDIHEIGTGSDAVPGGHSAGLGLTAPATMTVTGELSTTDGSAPKTSDGGAAATSSSSEGLAALPTSNPNHLLPGLLGAGLLLAL